MGKEFINFSKGDIEQKKIREKMELCYVAFIDILGFKEMAEKDMDKVILALRMIKAFSIERYRNVNGHIYTSPNDRYEYEKEYEPKVTTFSDSIVISEREDCCTLAEFINNLAYLQFELLLKGITVRGGVDLGYIYQDEFMVFGDGLIRAFELEHTRAIVPRIAIGKNAIKNTVKNYDLEFDQAIEDSVKYHYSEEQKSQLYDGYYSSSAIGAVVSDGDVSYVDYLYDELMPSFPNGKVIFANVRNVISIGLKHPEESVRKKYEWLKGEYNWAIDRCLYDYKQENSDFEQAERLTEELKME